MKLNITPNSKVASIYGKHQVKEKYYCNFGVNPKYIDFIRKGPIRFVGSDSEGELRILKNNYLFRRGAGTLLVKALKPATGVFLLRKNTLTMGYS